MNNGEYLSREEMTELFRKNAEKIRLANDVSQEKFATDCAMSPSTYKRIITGQRLIDAAYSLYRLCKVYDVRVYDLFELDDDIYRIATKLDKLAPEQLKHIEYIIDYELNK